MIWTKAAWFEASGYGQDESYVVKAIQLFLLTDSQKQELNKRDLSIADLLNGRYTGKDELYVLSVFRAWNLMLGWQQFGFGL